jgi:hypothetical protein
VPAPPLTLSWSTKSAYSRPNGALNKLDPRELSFAAWCCGCNGGRAVSEKWQPISTAPKDGRSILIFEAHVGTPGIVRVSRWRDDTIPSGWTGAENAPSHWLPLPPPPDRSNSSVRTDASACSLRRDGTESRAVGEATLGKAEAFPSDKFEGGRHGGASALERALASRSALSKILRGPMSMAHSWALLALLQPVHG